MARWWMVVSLGAWVGCTGGNSDLAEDGSTGTSGGTTPTLDPTPGDDPSLLGVYATVTVIQTAKLGTPRDLAFNPLVPGELWVVNQAFEGVTVLQATGTSSQTAIKFDDDFAGPHFLAQPSGIAFGDDGAMATIHDTDEKTQGPSGTPGDFMGPTLWTTDLDHFDGGHHGHIDMLHNSPLGGGIAWESGNAYWVFDGFHESITRYDFATPHELGGTDHSDGIIARYMEGEVKRLKNGTPSGLWYDHDTDELLIVDSGNNRILALDATSGTRGQNTAPNYDGGDQFRVENASWDVLIEGAEFGLQRPSGIDVADDGTIFLSDAGDPDGGVASLWAFSRDGEVLDMVELAHDINGIALGPDGVYFVDPNANEVLRLE